MATKTVGVRFVYRSVAMVELVTVMEAFWEKHGVDVRSMDQSNDAEACEERLFAGDVDFILGNHVSPYRQLQRGNPMVCLAQTVNFENLWLATSEEITSLPMLTGRHVVGEPLWDPDGRHVSHSPGTRLLFLSLNGVDTSQVSWVKGGSGSHLLETVREGKADACFIRPRLAEEARAAGLRVHEFPPFPMIHNMTLTCMLPRILKDSDAAKRMIRVMMDATQFFISNREETLGLLRNPVQEMPEGYADRIAERYDEIAEGYEPTLFPRAEAIVNVHRLSSMLYPEVEQVNPLELWDVRLLREIALEQKQRAS